MTYMIIEIETGLMDGFYQGEMGLEMARAYLHQMDWERPEYTHVLCEVMSSAKASIPDHLFLGTAPSTRRA